MTEKIKKIKDRIYEFDFSNTELVDGSELAEVNGVSDFVMAFRRRDLDKGVIVTPSGYRNGLVYKSSNDGEIYNNPNWIPDVINFAFNIFGLKKGRFYKLTVIGRDTGSNNIITDDRSLRVTNEDKELLMDFDLHNVDENTEYHAIFRTLDNESNLFFSIGKIVVSNIIIEEVEIIGDDVQETEIIPENVFEKGKLQLAAYGIFTTQPNTDTDYKGRYIPMLRYSGKGINLYFDKNTNQYILERDNIEDILGEAFTNLNYIIDFNFNKVVNKDLFTDYNIVDVNTDLSPNTLKQGYLVFEFTDADNNSVLYTNKDGRMVILIHKLY
jgi:hypothetical protein